MESMPKSKRKEQVTIHFPPPPDRTPEQVAAILERPKILRERIKDAEEIIRQLETELPHGSDQKKSEKLENQKSRKKEAENELKSTEERLKWETEHGY